MAKTASEFVKKAVSYIGYNEADGSYKKIIDLYNSHKPLAQGYKVKYTDAWCATFVSAVSIETGNTDIVPTECSCNRMVQLFKKIGEWVENDAYAANPGDIIFYDWNDTGSGDNTGVPDHVGIVEKRTGSVLTVIEGNNGSAVRRRTLSVNSKYIRGYGVPKFITGQALETKTSMTVEEAANGVIAGIYGNGAVRRKNIEALGLNYADVQRLVNEKLKSMGNSTVTYYTIKLGDTLSAIANKYNTTVYRIQQLNSEIIKNVNVIKAGQTIRVK